jgi:transcriptional regulator with GAF, ATPase, and Fis domain
VDAFRDDRLARTLVELAGTIAADTEHAVFPQVVTERVVEVLDVTAAGLMLIDASGALSIAAWSDERVHQLQQHQLREREGPCLDCWSTGEPVSQLLGGGGDGEPEDPWPGFCARARAVGFTSVHALPLRRRDRTLGAICLFLERSGALDLADVEAGQVIADVTAIAIVQQQAILEARTRAAQLQAALDSRVVIEQAKGLLAGWTGVDVGRAFELLRAYARSHNTELGEVARQLVDGRLRAQAFVRRPPSAQ